MTKEEIKNFVFAQKEATGKPIVRIAEEIGITPNMLYKVMRGARPITKRTEELVKAYIERNAQ